VPVAARTYRHGAIRLPLRDEIFKLGTNFYKVLKAPANVADAPGRWHCRCAAQSVAYRLLHPALAFPEVRVVCREGKTDHLLTELSLHHLDVILSDAPLNSSLSIRAYSHLLGESAVTFVGVESLAKKYRRGFPQSLDHAPMFLPTENTVLRRSLDQWFDANESVQSSVQSSRTVHL